MPPFQILDECPACRVESAVSALFDPIHACCLLGASAQSRCRLCGRRTRGQVLPPCGVPEDAEGRMRADGCPSCGSRMEEEERLALQCSSCGTAAHEEETQAGRRFGTEEDLRVALRQWAREEGHDSADEFAEASFLDGRVDRIFERIREGERVETNFDVLAFLFPEMAMASVIPGPEVGSGGGSGGGIGAGVGRGTGRVVRAEQPERVTEDGDEAPRPTETWDGEEELEEPSALDELRGKVWAPLLPLVSVMVADGRVHPAEEAFLRRFLDANRCPPIPANYVRVHRPEAVPTPPDHRAKERLLEAMVHLVHVDRQRDGSEFRIVEEYARAWGVDPGKVLHWDQVYNRRYATGLRRLWLILQSTMTRS